MLDIDIYNDRVEARGSIGNHAANSPRGQREGTGTMLKKGDKIVVFHDPVTCQKPEGDVALKQFLRRDGDMETWMVKFHGEAGQWERTIDASNIYPA